MNIKELIENEEFEVVDKIIENIGIDYFTAKDLAYMLENGYVTYVDGKEVNSAIEEITANETSVTIRFTYQYDEFIGYDEDGKPDFVKSYADGEDTYTKWFCM